MSLNTNPVSSAACLSYLHGQCPLSASDCPNLHIRPTSRHEKPCYDFLRGHCAYGTKCRWSHAVEGPQSSRRVGNEEHPRYRSSSEHYAYASPASAVVPVFGALYLPSQRPWYALASTPQPITPHSEFSSLELPLSLSTSPAASDAPSLSNASSDTESAYGSDPSHDTYDPVSASVLKLAMPQGMSAHAPPGFSPNAAHPYMFSPNMDYFPPLPPAPATPKLDRPPLSRRSTHKKAMAYRSKPCRYWIAEQNCPKGDQCTFRHDDEDADLRVRTPSELALLASTTKPSPPTPASPVRPLLPPRPKSEIEELRARGIYPITWRVIGGGVKMGGQLRTCQIFADGSCNMGDDCPYVHDEKEVLPPGGIRDVAATEALVLRPRPAVIVLRPAPVPRVTAADKAPATVAEALSPVSPLDLKSSLTLPADALQRARSTPPELTRRDTASERQKAFLAESPAF
ncbi:unnamed protein product [Peniophora sp. CBMAI 1063]|nr:unnamed protein product [Peniophora sp. CBMAI 1063]